jgi:hypothetical protein
MFSPSQGYVVLVMLVLVGVWAYRVGRKEERFRQEQLTAPPAGYPPELPPQRTWKTLLSYIFFAGCLAVGMILGVSGYLELSDQGTLLKAIEGIIFGFASWLTILLIIAFVRMGI